jgi:hypothetical protein
MQKQRGIPLNKLLEQAKPKAPPFKYSVPKK